MVDDDRSTELQARSPSRLDARDQADPDAWSSALLTLATRLGNGDVPVPDRRRRAWWVAAGTLAAAMVIAGLVIVLAGGGRGGGADDAEAGQAAAAPTATATTATRDPAIRAPAATGRTTAADATAANATAANGTTPTGSSTTGAPTTAVVAGAATANAASGGRAGTGGRAPVAALTATGLQAVDVGIAYGSEGTGVPDDARADLLELIVYLQRHPAVDAEVIGHTDSEGSEQFNLQLSQARAEAVLGFIAAGGIDRSRLSATGKGEAEPMADNGTSAGREQNRRIEIRLTGPAT